MKDEGEEEAGGSSHQLKLKAEDLQQRKKMFLLGYQFWLKIVAVFLFFAQVHGYIPASFLHKNFFF